ncbi:MAG TPA: DoxX family protein [Polyangiales bacterium]
MKALHHAPTAARILLGFVFTVFGANFFLHFLPTPPMEPGPAANFAMALFTSYVMVVVKVTEVSAGLLLLSNRFVPLALALLAPVVVGIVGFHLTLAPASGVPAYLTFVLELYLAYAYRSAFAPMLRARVAPTRDAFTVSEASARHVASPV